MRALLLLAALAGLWTAPAARAQTVVTSTNVEHVSVTLYRPPDASGASEISRGSPQGYALITETRTVTLPAGEAVIRFEGVAGNILPESALIAGLPDGVEEKNLDASLLSPRSLFDRALGRRVIIRRTDPATGKVVLQQATIRSSSAGAAILQIGNGFNDLRCSGLPEMLVYDGVPEGLSAKPTLSIRTISKVARTVTLTLSYLAGGFDWQADYIVTMRPDGRSADLFAWITLASSDVTSFPDADLQIVAGKLNRDDERDAESFGAGPGDLALKCWPLPQYNLYRNYAALPAPVSTMSGESLSDIVVTGSRVRKGSLQSVPIAVMATAEQLGDLKLYRFPRAVTVASNGQKQVAMLAKPSVKLWPVYQGTVDNDDARTWLILRGKNIVANGLGVPLPAGRAAVFGKVGDQTMLIGQSTTDDKTVGEDVEFVMGKSDNVKAEVKIVRERNREKRYVVTVTNANPWAIAYEGAIRIGQDERLTGAGAKLGRKNGYPLWSVTVPANGTAMLRYAVREIDPKKDGEDD